MSRRRTTLFRLKLAPIGNAAGIGSGAGTESSLEVEPQIGKIKLDLSIRFLIFSMILPWCVFVCLRVTSCDFVSNKIALS
jgi:hypothetical protein